MQPPSMPTTRLLFDSGIVYVIPNYQRAYVWNKEDQWELLWEDIEKIASPLVEEINSDNPNPPAPHFLGAAVLKIATGGPVHGAKRFTVVDGQQRLTTLQLLLAAVADVFHGYESLPELEEFARQMTVNFVSGKPSETEPNKILPLGGDFQLFSAVMENSRNHSSSAHITGTVAECYRFFLGKVGDWLASGEILGQTAKGRANALLTAIANHLQVVAIYLEPWENEAAIFESLNSRSEPLSQWEKVKNHIIFKAGNISGVDTGEWYNQYLAGLDDPQWRKETGQGAARRRLSDQFLDYWLESKLGQQVDTRHVYRTFRNKMDKEDSVGLGIWCADLKADSQYFLRWQDPTQELGGDLEAVFHSRRVALNIGAIWPVLLALSRIEMTPADKNRCLRALDSYLWRRSILNMTTRPYDTLSLELLKAFPQQPEGETPYSDAVINHLLQSYDEDSRLHWPEDDAVRDAILENKLKDNTVRKVLEAVERAIMRGKYPGNEKMAIARPIEHLMPQTRTPDNWPLPTDVSEERREEAIQHLGNLTLVQPGLNSKLGNRSWVAKRRILAEQDNLYINKDLLNHAPDDHWDEEHIRLRGERLANYILQIWPHGHAVTGEIERIQT